MLNIIVNSTVQDKTVALAVLYSNYDVSKCIYPPVNNLLTEDLPCRQEALETAKAIMHTEETNMEGTSFSKNITNNYTLEFCALMHQLTRDLDYIFVDMSDTRLRDEEMSILCAYLCAVSNVYKEIWVASGDMDITAFKPAHFYRVVNGRMRKISVDEPYVMFAENLR